MPHDPVAPPPHGDQARLAALVARIARRDEAALREFLQAVGRELHRQVLTIVRHPAAAEDVVAESCWQIWQQSARYSSQRGSVRAWIGAIARARAVDLVRQHEAMARRDARVRVDDAGAAAVACAMERRSHAATLRRLLGRVAPAQRQVLTLAFHFGLSQREIAGHCAMPLGTVKSHMRRGLQAVRQACLASGIEGSGEAA